jgi:PilZ domain-containing protein
MSTENRKTARRFVQHGAKIARADGVALGSCQMLDMSASGARLKVDEAQLIPDNFLLVLSHTGNLYRQCSVVWREGRTIGVEFVPSHRAKPAPQAK